MAGPRCPLGRRTTLALLGAIGLVLSARTADAGCRLADPPRSLTALLEHLDARPGPVVATRIDPSSPSPQVAPVPCRDETPARWPAPSTPTSAAILLAHRPEPASGPATLADPASTSPTQADRPGRLERPPRHTLLD